MTVFLTQNQQLLPYLEFPRYLLDVDINETAKLLYMILLDRARLSQHNDGWIDQNGYVYIYYTIANMAATLHKSEMTIKTALDTLTEKSLIFRRRQGAGRPNCIYVKIPAVTDRNLTTQGQENCPTDGKKAICQGERKLSTSNKEINNNKGKKQESNAHATFGSYENVLLTTQELAALQADYPDFVERIEHLSSYMASTGKTYQNYAATIRLWAAKDKPAVTNAKRTYEYKEDEGL